MDYILCPRLLLPGNVPCGVQQEIHHGLKKRSMYVEIHHQLSSSFLQINEHKISCPSMIELSLEFWCLIYSLKTCSIKSPFVFQYINKKFLFFCQLIISLLHSTTLIAYYIKPFKKWTMFLLKTEIKATPTEWSHTFVTIFLS